MSKDTKIRFKKKLRFYDLKNHKIFVLDQVASQNLSLIHQEQFVKNLKEI
jgi:hypothetical protein